MGDYAGHEAAIYRRISRAWGSHPGRNCIRQLLDSFEIAGPDGSHECLVHPPEFEDLWNIVDRFPMMRLPTSMLADVLRSLFLNLDFLHTDCQIIHTGTCRGGSPWSPFHSHLVSNLPGTNLRRRVDIKPGNILIGANGDDPIFTALEEKELSDPSPRKTVKWKGRRIYLSRRLQHPRLPNLPVLCDFGSAVVGYRKYLGTAQTDCYRAPEVIIQAPWSYEIDIWNVGCMVSGGETSPRNSM